MATIVVSALVAHTALHWTYDRVGALRQFPWPALTAADVATGLPWLVALLALAALAWRTMLLVRRSRGGSEKARPAGGYPISANRTSV